MKLSKTLGAVALAFGLTTAFGAARAADLKIGVVMPMSGPFAAHGKQIKHGIDLFLAEHGDKSLAGRSRSSSRTTPASPRRWPSARRRNC